MYICCLDKKKDMCPCAAAKVKLLADKTLLFPRKGIFCYSNTQMRAPTHMSTCSTYTRAPCMPIEVGLS
jgi:hypothetical protein